MTAMSGLCRGEDPIDGIEHLLGSTRDPRVEREERLEKLLVAESFGATARVRHTVGVEQ